MGTIAEKLREAAEDPGDNPQASRRDLLALVRRAQRLEIRHSEEETQSAAEDNKQQSPTLGSEPTHAARTRGGQTKGGGTVQLQVTSRLAVSREVPPYGARHAVPVRGSVPLEGGHSHCSTAGPHEPPIGPGQSDLARAAHTRAPVQGVTTLWASQRPQNTRG